MAGDRPSGRGGGGRDGPPDGPDGEGPADELPPSFRPHWAAGGCPDPSTIGALLDKRLPGAHRWRVLAHVLDCPRCEEAVDNALDWLIEIAGRLRGLDEEAENAVQDALHRTHVELKEELAVLRRRREEERAAEDQAAKERDEVQPTDRGAAIDVRPRRRWIVATAALAASVTILVGSAHVLRSRPSGRGPADAESLPQERPFPPRFGGGLPWAPAARSQGYVATGYQRHLPTAAMRYLAVAERRGRPPEAPTASLLGAVGAAQVLTGRVEPGVETLQRASAAQPTSARLLSDLGAALLVRAEENEREPAAGVGDLMAEDRAADLPAALEAISRALEISPRQEEALFNRALALERMYLWRSARKAWQAYLEVDDGSEWAAEARRRLAAIVVPKRPDPTQIRSEIVAAAATGERRRLAQLVLTYRQLARRTVQEELLPGWGRAWLAGDRDDAQRQLTAAVAVAEEWRAQTNDETLREAVAEVRAAVGDIRERLAAGYRALGEASRAFDSFDIDAAHAAAERAFGALPPTSRGAAWAALVRLVCDYYRGRDIEGDARQAVRLAPADAAVAARADWIVGLSRANHGNLATALASLRRSLEAYERLEEVDSSAWLHFMVGEVYGYMGSSDAGWKHRLAALAHKHALTGNQRELPVLVGSAMVAHFEGRPRVAIDLLDEGLIEPARDQPDQIALAYLWRSRVLHALGRDREARQDLQRASAWLLLATPLEQRFLSADLSLADGQLETDPDRAVRRISRAFARFRDVGMAWRLPGVLLARARARLRAGDAAAADADLRQGLVLLEEQQSGDPASLVWTSRMDEAEQLFDERVRLVLRNGDADEAFVIAEASRTRGWSAPARARHLRPAEIQTQLDRDVTVLFYSWLPERVLLWRLDEGGASLVEVPSRPAELAQLISAFRADLTVGAWTPMTHEVAMRLQAALVRPARVGTDRLVIVPDGALHSLPFSALVDPESGRFLVERHELTTATSVSGFLHRQTRFEARRQPPAEALVLGDPLVDRLLFPWFEPLAGAREEASAVAELYPRRELLLGAAASRAAFLALAGRREVVHFSGHAVPNRVDPQRSSLPLADDAGGVGLLVAADIARLDLTSTRTVVLSGCETGVGADGGEAPSSLATAFLAAGAPHVVASLWPIADAPSAPLMIAFHQRLRRGERPAAALRGAQLELLRGKEAVSSSPAVWAAFAAFDG